MYCIDTDYLHAIRIHVHSNVTPGYSCNVSYSAMYKHAHTMPMKYHGSLLVRDYFISLCKSKITNFCLQYKIGTDIGKDSICLRLMLFSVM